MIARLRNHVILVFSTLYGKKSFLPYRVKKTIPHSKWTLLKMNNYCCCIYLVIVVYGYFLNTTRKSLFFPFMNYQTSQNHLTTTCFLRFSETNLSIIEESRNSLLKLMIFTFRIGDKEQKH